MRVGRRGKDHRRIAGSAEQLADIADGQDGNKAGDPRTDLELDAFRLVESGNDIDRHLRLLSETIDRAVGSAVACLVVRMHVAL